MEDDEQSDPPPNIVREDFTGDPWANFDFASHTTPVQEGQQLNFSTRVVDLKRISSQTELAAYTFAVDRLHLNGKIEKNEWGPLAREHSREVFGAFE